MSTDYKSTVFLPKADFPMKAGLPEREPEWLARWQKIGLWRRLRAQSKGREKFILHDGPPYANGNIHIGHALNKILKDVINRTRQMQGYDANYVPGWDCHGLPIEWKIEERYREAGKDKDQVPVIDFRAECRAFAARWIDVQRDEFRRLGVQGDWDNPYTTMTNEAEAAIIEELGKFVLNGGLFRGFKPVMWSVVEKTSLAEAEVEYEDHTSNTIWVRFPVVHPPAAYYRSSPDRDPNSGNVAVGGPNTAQVAQRAGDVVIAVSDASVVIWTTTPWTLPANRAVAFGADIDYVVIEVRESGERSLARVGEKLICAEALLADMLAKAAITAHEIKARLKGRDMAGAVLAHPLRGLPEGRGGYDFDVPLLEGHHVTTDTGTGFVHIAPSHGADDFEIGQKHGIETPETVGPDGIYTDRVPGFKGLHVFKADQPVWEAIAAQGNLLARGKLTHSYPHSWRSKAPLIFRATPQWFISMTTNDLRHKALAAIDATRFVPTQGRNRIRSMVEDRPDWCVSRQRAWGVPITVFVNKKTGEVLRDARVMARIVEAARAGGSDVWFTADPSRFLTPEYDPKDFDKVTDILDVWFDSGSTHAFVLEKRPELATPADLYLEGSDQHRGWFQSSLLESCGTRGRAPYTTVLTHGFINDEQGRKMSKSLGNTTAPQEVCDKFGADILRLWVVASDYTEDLRVGPDIIRYQVDTYRRLRNTLRYLIGALDGFEEKERVEPAAMPELERWVLHRLYELDRLLQRAADDYDFHRFYSALHNFCAVDLSAFYFDIRKDALYCDAPGSARRRAVRTVMDHLFMCLTAWLAPATCFTAEEAWLARFPSDTDSVHLRNFPEVPADWQDDALAARWTSLRDARRVVTGALEGERAAKRIGSSLQAAPVVHLPADMMAAFDAAKAAGLDPAELFITSATTLTDAPPPEGAFTLADVPDIAVVAQPASGNKCGRCWKVLEEVGRFDPPDLCGRCADVVADVVK
ncbi:MAG: isoleucyl-tRNA synthetase ileS, partial [Pseudomonadota bacterium]